MVTVSRVPRSSSVLQQWGTPRPRGGSGWGRGVVLGPVVSPPLPLIVKREPERKGPGGSGGTQGTPHMRIQGKTPRPNPLLLLPRRPSFFSLSFSSFPLSGARTFLVICHSPPPSSPPLWSRTSHPNGHSSNPSLRSGPDSGSLPRARPLHLPRSHDQYPVKERGDSGGPLSLRRKLQADSYGVRWADPHQGLGGEGKSDGPRKPEVTGPPPRWERTPAPADPREGPSGKI